MEVWRSSLSAHKLSNIFLIIGFTIAFLALLLGISLYEDDERQNEEIRQFSYVNQSAMQISGLGQVGDALNTLLVQSDVNVDVFDYTIYLNDAKQTRTCEVRLKQSENSIYPLMEGTWTDENEEGVPTVVVGRGYEPYFIKKNDAVYLNINYCEYKVTGILSGKSGTLDYAVILDYETMPEKERVSLLQTTFLGIRFGSELSSVDETARAFKDLFFEKDIYYEAAFSTNSVAYNTAESDNLIFYILIYLFAMGICVICSELWIYERKTEIIICKTFGWKQDLIIERYYKEFLRVLSIGVLISLILQLVISIVGEQYISTSLPYLCIGVCMIIISSIIVFVIPMVKIQVYMPEELMSKEHSGDMSRVN